MLTSATAAWQQVLYGLAWGWRPGDRLLTSVHEYGSNAIALLQLARWGGTGCMGWLGHGLVGAFSPARQLGLNASWALGF